MTRWIEQLKNGQIPVTFVSALTLIAALVSIGFEVAFLLDALDMLRRDWQTLVMLRF